MLKWTPRIVQLLINLYNSTYFWLVYLLVGHYFQPCHVILQVFSLPGHLSIKNYQKLNKNKKCQVEIFIKNYLLKVSHQFQYRPFLPRFIVLTLEVLEKS